MKKLFGFTLLLAVLLLPASVCAAEKYRDQYTVEDANGKWTFTNYDSTGNKANLNLITSSSATGSCTAAKTGETWVLMPTSGSVPGGVGFTQTLPTAASGLRYRFITATGSTLSVVPAATTDLIYFGAVPSTRITSPASSGSTVTLVGYTNAWFVESMSTPADPSNYSRPWTAGTK